jgi:tetratricopeptide (TPR) repeat protein
VLLYEFDHDWSGAAEAFETARDLDPNYAQGLGWECLFRAVVGESEAALSICRKAVEVDPLSMHATWQLASTLASVGKLDESLAAFDRAMADRPDVPEIQLEKAGLLLANERYDEAIPEFEAWLKTEGVDSPEDIRTVIAGIREVGAREQGMQALIRLGAQGRIRPFNWVQLWAELGRMDRAMELLVAAHADGDPQVLFLGVDPRFAIIRDEPATRQILADIGLQTMSRE